LAWRGGVLTIVRLATVIPKCARTLGFFSGGYACWTWDFSDVEKNDGHDLLVSFLFVAVTLPLLIGGAIRGLRSTGLNIGELREPRPPQCYGG